MGLFKKHKEENIFDWFLRRVMLGYNIIGALMNITFLIIMAALNHKNLYITIALISLALINLTVAFVLFFTYSRNKKSKKIKLTKAGIKFLRLFVALISFSLTVSMWFTKFSNSVFMTALVIIYTIFYGISMVIQVAILVTKLIFICKNKKAGKKNESKIDGADKQLKSK